MMQLIKEKEQFHAVMFGGNLITNKSVFYNGSAAVKPYSNIFYFSHGFAARDVEAGLHGHEGFEIITFVLDGENLHYDTASKVWTPLKKGDFQIIQSGSGVEHAEKITKGSRSFQIWFDPNFKTALSQPPSYKDYTPNWNTVNENGFITQYYIGGNSEAKTVTEGLIIKKIMAENEKLRIMQLDETKNYHLYLMNGNAVINDVEIKENDVIKISGEKDCGIILKENAALFIIELPAKPSYETVWN